jgi:predicted dehydrogenase
MLRVGLIGAGWVTQHHLQAWQRQHPRARVVAIADPSLDRARERAQEFSIEHIYDSAQALLEQTQVDALDIAAPREIHAEVIRLAAAHGVAIMCQKPLAPNYEIARQVVAEVAGRVPFMVHENWRFRPHYRQIAEWLKAGRIGRVVQAQMTLLTSGFIADAQGKFPAIERQPFIAGLDRALVMEVLIHHIDVLRFLLGELTLMHSRLGKQCQAIKGEDRASLAFSGEQGAVVNLLANFAVHGESPVQTDQLLLIGESGTIRLSGDMLECLGPQPVQQRYDLKAGYADSYAAAIDHFVNGLLQAQAFETSADDNLRTLHLVEKIYSTG